MVTGTRKHNLLVELHARQHDFVSGVVQNLGGADEGPNPHELLEAALVACTIMTVQMYANRKNWKLESVDVSAHTDSEGEKTHMTRKISLHGDLDNEQRARLIDIANKCPIHKLLLSQIHIETVSQP